MLLLLLGLLLATLGGCTGVADRSAQARLATPVRAEASCGAWRARAAAAIRIGDLVAARSAWWNAMLTCPDPRQRAELAAELERIEAAAGAGRNLLLRADPVIRYRDHERRHRRLGEVAAATAAQLVADEYAREQPMVADLRP